MNFVFVSLQRIGTDRDSTSTSLAKELAKNHRVLYVNSPIDRRTYYSKHNDTFTQAHVNAVKVKNKNNLYALQENLWVLNPSGVIESINWLPFTSLFNLINWHNNKVFAGDIAEAAKSLGFSSYILVNDKDIFRSFYLKEILRPEKYIYLDRDYTVGMDYWKKHGVSLEPKLMAKADAVVCNSYDFTKRAKGFNQKSYYIGNGFDGKQYDINEVEQIPQDIKGIQRPIIGYVGALITLRLDLELMISLAKKRPQWNFVYIGWEDDQFKDSELHNLPNVYMLGKKHTKEVPAYIKYFDVCHNPQIVNKITIGNFPLKIVEYLSVGKPVVATSTNTMEEIFSEFVYLAKDQNSYLSSIEHALNEDENLGTLRVDFSENFTWQKVAESFMQCLA